MPIPFDAPIPQTDLDVLTRAGGSAYSTTNTVHRSYRCARYAAGLAPDAKGCVVECGVAAGTQLAAMLCGIAAAGRDMPAIGYDSFQGIPLATHRDTEQPGIGPVSVSPDVDPRSRLVSSGITVHPEKGVHENMRKWGFQSKYWLVAGWFQDTLPEKAPEFPIHVLRLDGDLYESTKVCLDNLLGRVIVGGIIIIDDWNLVGARAATMEALDIVGHTDQSEPLYLEYVGGRDAFVVQGLP